MTTSEIDVPGVFADAEEMYAAALERLAAGDVRDAAEKAWCSALQATNALILARTGELPPKSPNTSRALRTMAVTDSAVQRLQVEYFTRQAVLHGDCFYTGLCEPIEDTARLIRETADYIAQARRLAAA
ncbi:MAG: hypothetical protein OXI03_05335 [Chloroflexota bacterium]|nr:hypothetical protein [Chloroflexota bacterium]